MNQEYGGYVFLMHPKQKCYVQEVRMEQLKYGILWQNNCYKQFS